MGMYCLSLETALINLITGTSAKEDMFLLLVCCLLATLRKNFQTDLCEFSGKVGNGPMNK